MQIDIRHLTRRYGRVTALNDLTLTFRPGCITGLVGPNGAGKSTLLRILAGRECPDDGDILCDGISLFQKPEGILPKIGLMPDSLPDACAERVADYLDFYARACNLSGETRKTRLKEVMAFTQADTLRQRHLTELSKGMKQRISLARVLLASPEVLLLDEPSAGLDPRARIELRDDIRKLAKRGRTIVISSHILTELEDICDDVAILEKGTLRRQGSLGQLTGEVPAEKCTDTSTHITLGFKDAPDDALKQRLQALPHYLEMRETGRRNLEVTVDNADAFMAAAFSAGIPIVEFNRNPKSLEEFFIESTTGEVQ